MSIFRRSRTCDAALAPPHPRKRLVSASVTEAGWTSRLGHLRGPTFVVAEGLLMYLERAQVVQLARDLAEGANGVARLSSRTTTTVPRWSDRLG